MFKSGCCGSSGSMVEMDEKHDKESQEKETLKPEPESEELKFKLIYYNARLGGEAIRFIFHVAGITFEDHRIEDNEISDLKKKCKWGRFPVLEFEGNSIFSSTAISRYLAKRFSLTGKNEIDAARCDEYVEVTQDMRNAWISYFEAKDDNKKEELKNELVQNIFPDVLPKLNESVEANAMSSWLVGDSCTWADLFVVNFLEICEDTVDSDLLKQYPALVKLKDAVFSIPEIKRYIENRPETSH